MQTELSAARAAAAAFDLPAPVASVQPHGSGHIHRTFRIATGAGDGLLQRLNERVFPDPEALVDNARRIEVHLTGLTGAAAAAERRCLRLLPARHGGWLHRGDDGSVWRMLHFIDGAESHDVAPSLAHVERAAFAFGRFQRQLDDLPGGPLREVLPGFHDSPRRLARFEEAAAADRAGRAPAVAAETRRLLARRRLASALQGLPLPRRCVHNDTKLNNVLFEAGSANVLCVVDWDTVMPGLVAHDFGDLVRTAAASTAEDDPEPARAVIQPHTFAAIARGYLEATRDWLTPEERASLFVGARVILFEQALRFLTDHLNGDIYYPVRREGHNLDRCRVQLALLDSLEAQAQRLQPLLLPEAE